MLPLGNGIKLELGDAALCYFLYRGSVDFGFGSLDIINCPMACVTCDFLLEGLLFALLGVLFFSPVLIAI